MRIENNVLETIMQNDKIELTEYLIKIEKVESNLILDWGPLGISFFSLLVTGILAWRQYRMVKEQKEVAEKQLNFNLYERRYDIYRKGKLLLELIIRNNRLENEEIEIFQNIFNESKFLFKEDILKLQEKQYELSNKWGYISNSINSLHDDIGVLNQGINACRNRNNIQGENNLLRQKEVEYKVGIDNIVRELTQLESKGISDLKEDIKRIDEFDFNGLSIEGCWNILNELTAVQVKIFNILRDIYNSYDKIFSPYLDFSNIK